MCWTPDWEIATRCSLPDTVTRKTAVGRRARAPGFVPDSEEPTSTATRPPVPGRHRESIVNAGVRTPMPSGQGAQRQSEEAVQPPGRRALGYRVTGSHGPGESARGSGVGRSADAGQDSQRDLLRVAALAGTCPMESERASHRQEMPSHRVRLQIAGPPRNRPVPGRATAGWQRPQNDGARNAGASGCVRRRLRLGPSRGERQRKGAAGRCCPGAGKLSHAAGSGVSSAPSAVPSAGLHFPRDGPAR